MPSPTRRFFHYLWLVLRYPFWLGLGALVGFLIPYTWVLNQSVHARFGDLVFSVPTRIYARPLPLSVGEPMTAAALETELSFAGYQKREQADVVDSYAKNGNRFVIFSSVFTGTDGRLPARKVVVTLGKREVTALTNAGGEPITSAKLNPARIATFYGSQQVERTLVTLRDVPPLLITGLQAVEDRRFNTNIGIDVIGIMRAAWADLRAGKIVQGGSTLTQQLVRNLFLDRSQTLVRKANEALLAILIKLNYSKSRILTAYINEVFLGQRGNQAVHGFAAASEFYFNRPLRRLDPQQIALLVGLVRGPSYYSPRRHPGNALARRNHVLDVFHETGLLTAEQAAKYKADPLGITDVPHLRHDRFPAFMDLVRAQLRHDFTEDELRSGGLSVFTTLDPAAQLYTEQAITTTIKGLGKKGKHLQAAAVVTNPHTGQVLAMTGGRRAGFPGYNRALRAHRQIGSTIKPLIYLVALAQPDKWSLASMISDAPVHIKQPDGSVWSPQNDDHRSHGNVLLVNALVHSWNLATIHLGLAVGVDKIHKFLTSFGLKNVNPSPSLLLGALDLSPAELAYLYQFIASDGHALPLLAINGVVNEHGQLIRKYSVRADRKSYNLAVKLIRYAMQQVALRGTASAITKGGLGWLHAAGKTGTSDEQRDSWFVGFTSDRLGVFWMGRDDNKPTRLWGSSGALVAWRHLFSRMPTKPLPLPTKPEAGLSYAWIDQDSGARVKPNCGNARVMPFIEGYEPKTEYPCHWGIPQTPEPSQQDVPQLQPDGIFIQPALPALNEQKSHSLW